MMLSSFLLLLFLRYSTCSDTLCEVANSFAVEGRCYFQSRNEAIHSEGKSACQDVYVGAQYASITSYDDETKICESVESGLFLWIGLSRPYGSVGWDWVDGSEWSYENWADEPITTETCAALSTLDCSWDAYPSSECSDPAHSNRVLCYYEEFWCSGIVSTSEGVCNGRGVCIQENKCECDNQWTGSNCDVSIEGTSIGISLAVVSFSCCFCCLPAILICCCLIAPCFLLTFIVCCSAFCLGGVLFILETPMSGRSSKHERKNMKKKRDKYLLDENDIDNDSSNELIAKLRINKSLFIIKLDEITLLKVLGKGGSDSTVYKCDFNGTAVAFKCFRSNSLCKNQQIFDEFETEVSILSSLSHPHTLRFYGALLEPPRVGIVMEFCPKGDLYFFLKRYINNDDEDEDELIESALDEKKEYPIDERIRMLYEISLAMKFLHSRKIIHRDLKPENVLIDGEEKCKLMDFGSSKFVQRMSLQKTKRLGTPNYMSPEIVLGTDYNFAVDVYSFGIMIFTVCTGNFQPYGDLVPCVELKVANDPLYRPRIEELEDTLGAVGEWLKDMAVLCWNHDPEKRPDFDRICQVMKKEKI